MAVLKSQILITDIPKATFSSDWSAKLKSSIFEEHFPEAVRNLQYYTPLQFLNRIVIILDDETVATKIYEYLRTEKLILNLNAKLYLTENLTKPRSKSSSQVGLDMPLSDDFLNLRVDPNSSAKQPGEDGAFAKPLLSIDTDPSHTGISTASLQVGSPSLSPDKSCIGSPTLLKFSDDDQKLHSYQEPLPKLNDINKLETATSNSSSNLNIRKNKDSSEPMSPSITIKDYL
ncbi:hypothetical protein TPHA_0F03240 [Tetrapisispora phaffii CBS 4417]|uniref:Uncharacterized protein n=1 Tax=Tetrapisispora phaffii (strain ATCC 24235 / CBS 4417 / NBRC 1672 / NRRL Y-8282 / UCD 70-5) TaxID=1071381 RepID=G8BUL9_TETPH|nr:hypothetical protein TPHA_0F03240 [Tetrapisispora phaffii CBS 4417]CCE63805.1 hypothetical protein TPHA_0F03240 [Tetrapisispora phaffii CBS 4417]